MTVLGCGVASGSSRTAFRGCAAAYLCVFLAGATPALLRRTFLRRGGRTHHGCRYWVVVLSCFERILPPPAESVWARLRGLAKLSVVAPCLAFVRYWREAESIYRNLNEGRRLYLDGPRPQWNLQEIR
jgi:hypothetical protein